MRDSKAHSKLSESANEYILINGEDMNYLREEVAKFQTNHSTGQNDP
jgi:hypothetical protein